MMTTNKTRRLLDAVLLLDKPLGLSSNQALQRVKYLFQVKKAGHTGSLDPLATGLLPICFGEATKFSQFWFDADKTYEVRAHLGVRMTTGDLEGECVATRPVPPLSASACQLALNQFLGETQQTPTMYSALKHQGKPLYEYARRGIVIDRPSRPIYIESIELINYEAPFLDFRVRCSKGTYIRSLVDDLGEALGCGAHVAVLRRISVGDLMAADMVSLPQLTDCKDDLNRLDVYLSPITRLLGHLPVKNLVSREVQKIKLGQFIRPYPAVSPGMIVLLADDGKFLGMGEVNEQGLLNPKRLISTAVR